MWSKKATKNEENADTAVVSLLVTLFFDFGRSSANSDKVIIIILYPFLPLCVTVHTETDIIKLKLVLQQWILFLRILSLFFLTQLGCSCPLSLYLKALCMLAASFTA